MARGGISIRIDVNRFPVIARRLPGAAGNVVREHGENAERTAKAIVPVDTGALRASIEFRMTDETRGELVAGEGLPDIRDSAQEFGTRFMPAHPYLRPAAERERAGFVRDMRSLERWLK